MAKNNKKKRRTSKKRVSEKRTIFSKKFLAIVIISLLSSLAVVYGVNYFELFSTKKQTQKYDEKSTEILMNKMKKMLDNEKKRLAHLPKYTKVKKAPKLPPMAVKKTKKIEEQKEVEKQNAFSEIKDYQNSLKKTPKKPRIVKKTKYTGKPRLAIILDDVSFAHETKIIKKIPFKVTPSFFPPTKRHPDTAKLSKDFRFKMVHLPLEASNFGSPEPKTLNVGDSTEKIRARIKQIKKWFPSVKYYNNHTGSTFTSNYQAMDRFMKVMKEEKLHFVDSRTTAATKAPQIAKKYKIHLYSRDVFLDNSSKPDLIRKQLKRAVAIAKKRGYAIAIGHPHKNTLKVLIGAKNLLKGVQLVYLKDLQ